MQTDVTLSGMRFHVRVGILPHEQEHPQPLDVTLTARLATGAVLLDYRALHALTAEVLGASPLHYLEEIASTLVTRTCELPGVSSARVAIRKPHVMLDGPLDFAEIVVDSRVA